MKRIVLLLALLATAADAAPWSSRWLVAGRKAEASIYTITLAASTQQTLPARILSSVFRWRTPTAAIYNNAALAPLSEVQINIQLVAGAAANALALRTTWTVASVEWSATGSGYPFRVSLSPATQTDVDASSEFSLYMNDAATWAVLTPGASVYLDIGACVTSCLTGL